MDSSDDFEPRLGRIRNLGAGRGKKYLHRVLAAANLARSSGVGGDRRSRFDGSRIGRGSGVGRVLANRDIYAAFRQRRVIVKSRIVKLAGRGAAAARAHLRYIERDGTTREGGRGELYGPDTGRVDGKAFLERADGDRHQFRFIVSAEDGIEYEDLRPLTRRLMERMEEDLGTKLDWVAVDHFNTGHPHTHIVVRGKDERGKDLIIAREYITGGMRERAAELVDFDLGPRSADTIEARLRGEIDQERLTSIDRALLREVESDVLVSSTARSIFSQTLRVGRLRKLERMGLAEKAGASHWRLSPDLADTLKRMGERGDIIRTMQRAYAARSEPPALADQVIYDPTAEDTRPIVGRIVERGLSDELNDRHYLIIEATDGRSHYVEIGRGEQVEARVAGAIVRIAPVPSAIRDADRIVAEIALRNGGRYDIDAHLRYDPTATEAFAEAHVRRLEAIRRLTGGVTREPDGTWIIADDHLDHAAAYEAARSKDRPVTVETLSPQPIERLVSADAATWLDRETLAAEPTPLRDAGFGHEVREAQARRRQWLIAQELAIETDGQTIYRPDLIETLQRRELLRVGTKLSGDVDMAFVETSPGARIDGIYRRQIDTLGGRYALIEKSREFTLVPWRPELERQIGKQVSGIMRSDRISWSFGRGRSGPNIS